MQANGAVKLAAWKMAKQAPARSHAQVCRMLCLLAQPGRGLHSTMGDTVQGLAVCHWYKCMLRKPEPRCTRWVLRSSCRLVRMALHCLSLSDSTELSTVGCVHLDMSRCVRAAGICMSVVIAGGALPRSLAQRLVDALKCAQR